jgi:hypothetical protein
MAAKSDLLRCYCTGVAHGVAFVWIVGWALSHRFEALAPMFGPTSWLPVPLALVLVLAGVRLLPRSATNRHSG